MLEPQVTVLMAAYNAEATIAPAIGSVLRQTRRDLELVVVDDGSTDSTASVVRSFSGDPRVRLIQHPNSGLAASRNRGIAEARGRYFSLLDADDLWLPTYLEVMLEALESDAGAGVACTGAWVLDDVTKQTRRAPWGGHSAAPPPRDARALLIRLLDGNFIWGSATIRRSALDRVGPFNASLRATEDYELWLRLAANGYYAVRPPGILGVYRQQARSLTRNDLLMQTSLREVYRLVSEEYDVQADVRAKARQRLASTERRIAALRGESRAAALYFRLRRSTRVAGERLLRPLLYSSTPPAELAKLFADLRAV